MKKTLVIILPVSVCLLLITAFLLFSGPSGALAYEGRHLSEWLLLVTSSSQQEGDHATRAVRQIGADALPFLEELVENAHFESFKVRVGKWFRRQEHPVHDIRRVVFGGYGTLGDVAEPSVPFLLEKLKHTEPTVRSTAAGALGWIGPSAGKAVPGLIALLNDDIGYVRRDAASALGKINAGTNDEAVINALKQALNDKDRQAQEYAKRALESVRQNADTPEAVE